jgi:hypothetical protein
MLGTKMNEKIRYGRDETFPLKLFGMMIPSLPSLMVRLTGTLIRFKSDANKAGRIFKNELIKHGIDKDTADDLTEIYKESSEIKSFIQRLN